MPDMFIPFGMKKCGCTFEMMSREGRRGVLIDPCPVHRHDFEHAITIGMVTTIEEK